MKKLKFRDLLFATLGVGILYHEVVLVPSAEPLLIFAAFFLLGLIPAARADENDQSSIKAWLRAWLLKDLENELDNSRHDSTREEELRGKR